LIGESERRRGCDETNDSTGKGREFGGVLVEVQVVVVQRFVLSVFFVEELELTAVVAGGATAAAAVVVAAVGSRTALDIVILLRVGD
jgi:hypothetical protein